MTTNHVHQTPLFPQTGKVAIYARVAPRTRQARIPQSDDLSALALQRGFRTEQIMVFEDTHTSGKTAIGEREALSTLLHKIAHPSANEETIQAIIVFSEDKLFRDAKPADIAMFIQTCIEHEVKLYTPTFVYAFSLPTHVAQFRF